MKGRIVLGALLVSVALCSQGFGFDLLDNLLGLSRCDSCAPACCEPACCEQACCETKCCAPEPACCEPACGCGCKSGCDLFGGLKGLFACKSCCNTCCEPACCEKACAPEPCCCEKPACCEKSCCEPACCEPACGCKKHCCLLDMFDGLFACKKCCCKSACCEPACCEATCEAGCGCNGGGEGAPMKAPKEKAAPLPKAPKADPSASARPGHNLYQASRSIVRN